MDCPLQDSRLSVHYKGMLVDDKKTVFYDTRIDNGGQPLEFCSGEGLVSRYLYHTHYRTNRKLKNNALEDMPNFPASSSSMSLWFLSFKVKCRQDIIYAILKKNVLDICLENHIFL